LVLLSILYNMQRSFTMCIATCMRPWPLRASVLRASVALAQGKISRRRKVENKPQTLMQDNLTSRFVSDLWTLKTGFRRTSLNLTFRCGSSRSFGSNVLLLSPEYCSASLGLWSQGTRQYLDQCEGSLRILAGSYTRRSYLNT